MVPPLQGRFYFQEGFVGFARGWCQRLRDLVAGVIRAVVQFFQKLWNRNSVSQPQTPAATPVAVSPTARASVLPAPPVVTSIRRATSSFQNGFIDCRYNQFNIYEHPELQGIPRDVATCGFADFTLARLFLEDPNGGRPYQDQMEIALIQGAREKHAFKTAKGIARNDYNTTLEEANSHFATLHPAHLDPFVLRPNQEEMMFQGQIERLIAAAENNRGVAAAVYIRGPTSFLIAIDMREGHPPEFYYFDSHGKQAAAPGQNGAFLYNAGSKNDLARYMAANQKAMDLGEIMGDMYDTCEGVILT